MHHKKSRARAAAALALGALLLLGATAAGAQIAAPDDWRKEVAFWKKAGCSHVLAHTTFTSAIHERIKGKTYDDHLKAVTQYRDAVKDLL